jgi:hypothetical protein
MGERHGISHLGRVELKGQGEVKAPEKPKPAPPRLRPDQIGTVHVGLCGSGCQFTAWRIPRTFVASVTLQDLLHVRIQRRTRDDPVRESMLVGYALQPLVSPTGFDGSHPVSMCNRSDNVLVAGIREVIFQQVVLGNRAHVAFQSRRQEMLLKPRVFLRRDPKGDGAVTTDCATGLGSRECLAPSQLISVELVLCP